ncbi:MAG TPA: SpoIID/LytB domain-containing protein [Chthonomonadaceae bacterium]|nr:SpoIID/LytB domain-containing protein [Chthonomonadaceae bacterium]
MKRARTSACHHFLPARSYLILGLLALLALACALASSRAHAAPSAGYIADSPLVRVGLMRFAGATALTLTAEPGARLLGPEGRERAAGMGPWTITVTQAGARASDAQGQELGTAPAGAVWRLQSDAADTVLGLAAPGRPPRHYRGSLEVRVAAGRLRVVNEVPLETYLRGVVGSEMGGGAPLEALKAQAVASRTYALRSLGQWASEGYDLRDSTDSQVYGGVEAEQPDCDRAIRETSGLILTVDNQPIVAAFCADCGGVTAPGPTPEACPRSVVDADAHVGSRSRYHTWTLRYTPQRLAALLGRQPALRAPGTLSAVEVAETDVSGRVRRLRLTWRQPPKPPAVPLPDTPEDIPDRPQDGEAASLEAPQRTPAPDKNAGADTPPTPAPSSSKSQKRAPAPRQAPPAPPPVVREITGNLLRKLLGVDTLRSTLFTVHRAPGGAFVFEGHGWGHGRGMCQAGAMAMAAGPSASDFQAILRRYYAGADLTHLRYREAEDEESVGEGHGEEAAHGR